jgi:F-type H+-transporting ATPase subunit delta
LAESISIVSGIAGRYATALVELAGEENAIDRVDGDLRSFEGLLDLSEDLEQLVHSPVFSAEQQLNAVTSILEKAGISGIAANFIKLVAAKRRLFAMRRMIEIYRALVAQKRGLMTAEVTVAEPLNAVNRKTVQDALAGVTGKTVSLVEKVDPSIIGGLIVKMGSKMVDSSVRTRLNSIKLAMKEVG